MPIIEGELWKHPGHPGMIVVTTSGSIDRSGELVMCQGPALEAVKRIPGIQVECAKVIQARAEQGVFGFLPVRPSRPELKLIGFGIFQTQYEYDQPADPLLIQQSLTRLQSFATSNPHVKMRMNYPGIGSEGLPVEEVAPLITSVPANVTICHQGEVPSSVPQRLTGSKDLFLAIERWVQEGSSDYAIDYLIDNGYDRQTAVDQVMAVRRLLQEQSERNAERLRQRQPAHWEQTNLNL